MLQCIGYMDRLDYVSMLCNEHVFVMAVEHIMTVSIAVSDSVLRCIMLEVTRMLNHLLNIACHAGDLGCLLCVLWLFEDRELMYMMSAVASGARLHSYMIIPGGLRTSISAVVMSDIVIYVAGLVGRIELILVIAVQHRLWLYRLVNVGVVGSAMSSSLSGVLLRCHGLT